MSATVVQAELGRTGEEESCQKDSCQLSVDSCQKESCEIEAALDPAADDTAEEVRNGNASRAEVRSAEPIMGDLSAPFDFAQGRLLKSCPDANPPSLTDEQVSILTKFITEVPESEVENTAQAKRLAKQRGRVAEHPGGC